MSYVSHQHTDQKITKSSIKGYAVWAAQHIRCGWDPYLLSFMFNHVPGSRASVSRQMQREVERVYATSLTRVIRKPRCQAAQGKEPILIACPDLPVPKRQKQSLRDVIINDGLHYQGIALILPGSRLKDGLDVHFRHHQALYVHRERPLARVHAQPIVHDPGYVTEYALKSLPRQRFSLDDVLILPRNRNGLPAVSDRISCHS